MRKTESRGQNLKEQAEKFQKLLSELEAHLNSGFFLSFIGKIVVDERKIYTVLNELRSLEFDLEEEKKEEDPVTALVSRKGSVTMETPGEMIEAAREEAEQIRKGAMEFADKALKDMEQRMTDMLNTIKDGRRAIKERQ